MVRTCSLGQSGPSGSLQTVFSDELQQILRQCAEETGAHKLEIHAGDGLVIATPNEAANSEQPQNTIFPLGDGFRLILYFEGVRPADWRGAAERAARALRECKKRYPNNVYPLLREPPENLTERDRIIARIAAYLDAFQNSQGMVGAAIAIGYQPLCTAGDLTQPHLDRLPLVIRQVESAANKAVGTSHATIIREDLFATSFYFDAYLVALFSRPFSADFVRHRAKLVTREVSPLLAMLDTPPDDPAHVAPVPE